SSIFSTFIVSSSMLSSISSKSSMFSIFKCSSLSTSSILSTLIASSSMLSSIFYQLHQYCQL
ncbi:hypothetical protein, partial [Brachyspira pilosicoli]|uniref:hypothetical protein n=1 Tax=Brachyspira pilosicoli TaxID=52584 RepID=UPI001E3B665A